MLICEIEELIKELYQASKSRVQEIISLLEGELSRREIESPAKDMAEWAKEEGVEAEEDALDNAHECQHIPKAREILSKIRQMSESELSLTNTVLALKLTFIRIYDNKLYDNRLL